MLKPTANIRLRSDLHFFSQSRRGRHVWVVKDPVTSKFFQFQEHEYRILAWLDGSHSLEQLQKRFEGDFAPMRLSLTRLRQFLAQLSRSGLVIHDTDSQADQLIARQAEHRRRVIWQTVTNPLSIRFRGVDPDRLLNRMEPSFRWVYSKTSLLAISTLVCVAFILTLARRSEIVGKLPELNALLSPVNLLGLAFAVGITKLLHEFGHALTLKRFGGQCHELGVMLLVFTPCLYCDVSDAWRLSSRWQRIAITAAGMLVEISLAALATIVWWFSSAGMVNTLCLNVMLVCTVGTVLLNGNPLLRYDGYYILSDLWDRPNLWSTSRAKLKRQLSSWCLGLGHRSASSSGPGDRLEIVYAVASMMYRFFVLAAILWMVFHVLDPLGFGVLAKALSLIVVSGLVAAGVKPAVAFWQNPAAMRSVHKGRFSLTLVAGGLVFFALFFVPIPYRMTAPLVVHPANARNVVVAVPGSLVATSRPGQRIGRNEVVAELENLELRRELERMRAQRDRQRSRLRNLESLRSTHPELSAQIPTAREILEDAEQQFKQLERDVRLLQIRSPIDGIVIAPPSLVRDAKNGLSAWQGIPLDPVNKTATLERHDLLCLVAPAEQFEAVVYLDQANVAWVQPGQHVRLTVDLHPGHFASGQVRQISREPAEQAPEQLAVDQSLATTMDPHRNLVPVSTTYKAYVSIDTDVKRGKVLMRTGARGWAKITLSPEPLAPRIGRWIKQTFGTIW